MGRPRVEKEPLYMSKVKCSYKPDGIITVIRPADGGGVEYSCTLGCATEENNLPRCVRGDRRGTPVQPFCTAGNQL